MANDCLVTKLKGVVNNPALPRLGSLPIKFKAAEEPSATSNKMTVQNSSTATSNLSIKVTSGIAHISSTPISDWNDHTQGSTEITLAPGNSAEIYITNADCTIEINSKYDLFLLYLASGTSIDWKDVFTPKLFDLRSDFGGFANLDGAVEAIKSMPVDLDCLVIPATPASWNIKQMPPEVIRAIGEKNVRGLKIDGWVVDAGVTLADLLAGTNNLEWIYFCGNSVGGNLNFFLNNGQKKFPGLSGVVFSSYNTKLVREAEDVALLRSLGVTVIEA